MKAILSTLQEFNLTWYPITYNGGYSIEFVKYSVEYIHSLPYIPVSLPPSLHCALCQRIKNIRHTNIVIPNLQPETLYYYRIVAWNLRAYNYSQWYQERTKSTI